MEGWVGGRGARKRGASSLSLESYGLIIAESTHKGVNWRWKCVTQVPQQRSESPTVTLSWQTCKYKVHKLHLKVHKLHPQARALWASFWASFCLKFLIIANVSVQSKVLRGWIRSGRGPAPGSISLAGLASVA